MILSSVVFLLVGLRAVLGLTNDCMKCGTQHVMSFRPDCSAPVYTNCLCQFKPVDYFMLKPGNDAKDDTICLNDYFGAPIGTTLTYTPTFCDEAGQPVPPIFDIQIGIAKIPQPTMYLRAVSNAKRGDYYFKLIVANSTASFDSDVFQATVLADDFDYHKQCGTWGNSWSSLFGPAALTTAIKLSAQELRGWYYFVLGLTLGNMAGWILILILSCTSPVASEFMEKYAWIPQILTTLTGGVFAFIAGKIWEKKQDQGLLQQN
jgi:hypothetical protein